MPSLVHSYSKYAPVASSFLVLVLGSKEETVIVGCPFSKQVAILSHEFLCLVLFFMGREKNPSKFS